MQIMETYNPGNEGYDPLRTKEYGNNGWIVTHKDKPTLAIERGTGWYCVLPTVYEQDFIPMARALFG